MDYTGVRKRNEEVIKMLTSILIAGLMFAPAIVGLGAAMIGGEQKTA